MEYKVKVVPDHALPAAVKRVMVEMDGEPAVLVLAESVMDNWHFLQEWQRLYGSKNGWYHLHAV